MTTPQKQDGPHSNFGSDIKTGDATHSWRGYEKVYLWKKPYYGSQEGLKKVLESKKGDCLGVFMGVGGGADLGVPMHGLDFQPAPKEGAPGPTY